MWGGGESGKKTKEYKDYSGNIVKTVWDEFYEEMIKKSIIKRVLKPLVIESVASLDDYDNKQYDLKPANPPRERHDLKTESKVMGDDPKEPTGAEVPPSEPVEPEQPIIDAEVTETKFRENHKTDECRADKALWWWPECRKKWNIFEGELWKSSDMKLWEAKICPDCDLLVQ